MFNSPWRRYVIPLCLSLILLVGACAQESSRYDQVQEETTGRGAPAAVSQEAKPGSAFNKFFPKPAQGYKVVPSQEKKGFAEYKLNKDGKTVAVLSISDTISNPSAAAKYDNSSSKVSGYPAVNQGSTGTGILVNGRYQVKVLSRDPSFTESDRLEWLENFDLRGLAGLKTTNADKRQTPTVKAPALSPQPAT